MDEISPAEEMSLWNYLNRIARLHRAKPVSDNFRFAVGLSAYVMPSEVGVSKDVALQRAACSAIVTRWRNGRDIEP